MHTFEYERFKRTFLQNQLSEKAQCLLVHRGWTRGAYFKTEGEEKLLKQTAMETMFGDFYIAGRIFWSHFITWNWFGIYGNMFFLRASGREW